MSTIPEMTESNLPEDGLRFFHGLANWVERFKGKKRYHIEWKKGQKKLTLLKCYKPKQKEPLSVPDKLPENSLYVPNWCSGRQVISQLRHAFCHNNLKYNTQLEQYEIKLSDKTKIAGRFSLEAVREFVKVYLEPKEPKNNAKQ